MQRSLLSQFHPNLDVLPQRVVHHLDPCNLPGQVGYACTQAFQVTWKCGVNVPYNEIIPICSTLQSSFSLKLKGCKLSRTLA